MLPELSFTKILKLFLSSIGIKPKSGKYCVSSRINISPSLIINDWLSYILYQYINFDNLIFFCSGLEKSLLTILPQINHWFLCINCPWKHRREGRVWWKMLLPRGGRYLNKSPELNNTWLEKKLKSSGFVKPTPASCFYGTRSRKSIKSPWTSDI